VNKDYQFGTRRWTPLADVWWQHCSEAISCSSTVLATHHLQCLQSLNTVAQRISTAVSDNAAPWTRRLVASW